MIDAYLLVKWLHILSSTVLFGAGLGTALQMVLAHRSGDARVIAGVTRNIVIADWFTVVPSGIAQPVTGYALIRLVDDDPWAGWLLLAYALYALAGMCWLIVVRLQIRMRDLAAEAVADGSALPQEYFRLFRWWFALGWPAFIGLVIVFGLMVARPF